MQDHGNDPCPEDWMRIVKDEPGTICHVLREIYRDTPDTGIRLKCRIATSMAKRMAKKLTWWKEKQNGLQG